MKKFCIAINSREIQDSQSTCYGSIEIGDFKEDFKINTSFWTPDEYVENWRKSITWLLKGNHKSCLITSITDPQDSTYLFWWPMYRVDQKVIIQNGILFFDQLQQPLDIENPHSSVLERETISEEGLPISEWETDIEGMITFLERI